MDRRFRTSARCTLLAVGAAWALTLAFATAANGQNITGTLTGTVMDQSRAVLPGVQLTLRNVDTGFTRVLITDEHGQYSAPLLPLGPYEIEAFLDGFAKKTVQGLRVQLDQTLRVEITLELGTLSNEVTVVGSAPLLKTSTSEMGEVIENKRVVDLPLNGRQFLELAELNSGASLTSASFDTRLQSSGPRIIMNGQMEQYNNYTVDGTDATDPYYRTLAFSPSVDAIQEFKILTGNYAAEFGGFTGAMVNISTKAGTNRIQGGAFEFMRDDSLDARNFFDDKSKPTPPFHQDQFGATFGGPIRQNRLFFFASYEGLRRDKALTSIVTVPTDGMRSGDLTELIARGQPAPIDPLTGQKFPGNIIPTSRFDPVARALLPLIPSGTNGGFNFLAQRPETVDNNQASIRVDYSLSQANNMFGRYTVDDSKDLRPGASSYQDIRVATRAHNFTLSDMHLLSKTIINEFRMGFNKVSGGENLAELLDFPSRAGIQGVTALPQFVGVPGISITSLGSYGSTGNLISRNDLTWQLLDNVTLLRGRHSMKFGGTFSRYHFSPTGDGGARGSMSFDGSVTGNAYADFLLGIPRTATIARGTRVINGRSYLAAGYFQDDWRASDRLTINAGIRYEYLAPVTELKGQLATLDFRDLSSPRFVVVTDDQSLWAPNIANRIGLPIVTAAQAGLPSSLIIPTKRDWAPRFGFAYQPFGNGTVVRGGYGIFYANPSFNWAGQLRLNPPLLDSLSIQNTARQTSQFVFQAPAAGNTSGFPVDVNFRIGYTQQYFVNYQRALGPKMVVEAAYVGSKGSNLMKLNSPNQPRPGPGLQAPRRPIPALGVLTFNESNNRSLYNALQLRFQRPMDKGLGFTLEYTLAKSMDLASTLNGSSGDFAREQDHQNPDAEWGLSVFDHRNRFVANLVAELPFGPGRRFEGPSGFVRKLIEGWQVAGVITLQDGTPFTVTSGVDRSNTGNSDRPNLVGDPNLPSNKQTVQQFFNTSAFVLNDPFTFGNAGRNIVRGPSFRNVNLTISRTAAISGTRSLEFRVEGFNVLNQAHFNTPVGNMSLLTFGRITSAQDARQIQLALKYHF